MEMTISQHLTWKGLRRSVHDICKKCHTCQIAKTTKRKYGHIPEKSPEVKPWDVLCVDMIGPYTIPCKKGKDLILWAVMMIDPATGWFEIADVSTKRADVVANVIEQTWLIRYPWPTQVVLDRGREFMAEFSRMVINDYGIKKKPITKRNPQANAIIERVHQTIGHMLRTALTNTNDLETKDPWKGILAAVAFAVRATVHSTTRATPMQIVFGRDAIFNIRHIADWRYIEERKRKLIQRNNKRENNARIPHTYAVGDKILIKNAQSTKYGTNAYSGPYTITSVYDNGTVRVDEGPLTDIYNIRNITPYHE